MTILAAVFAALAIVAAQMLHGGLLVPAFSAPSHILLIVAALPALWVALRNPAPTGPGALAAVAVFIGYVVWRCGHAPDQLLGRVELGQALAAGLAFAIGYGGLQDSRGRFVFLGIVIAAAAGQAVIGFIQFAHGGLAAPLGWMSVELRQFYESRFATRAHGLFLNPNQFAWLVGWAALFCVSLAVWGRVKVIWRVVLIYLALMFIVAAVLSGSRGGLASLLAGLAVFSGLSVVGVMTMMKRGRAVAIAGVLVLVVLCLGMGAFIYSSNWVMQGRVSAWEQVDLNSWSQADVRSLLLEHAFRQFQAAPLVGFGPGTFVYAARLYRTDNQPNDALFAHDDWLQTLVEYGFVGFSIALLAVLILLGGGIRRFFAALRRRALSGDRPQSNSAAILIGAVSATVAFCAHSFTDFNMHVPANALLAGATLGLLAGTGGEVGPKRRLQTGVLRAFGGLVMACLAVALGLFVYQHGYADYRSLRAANALAEGDVKTALADTVEGLQWAPGDAALLATRGSARYSYESALQLEKDAIAAANEPADEEESNPDGSGEAAAAATDEEDEKPVLAPAEREKFYRGAAEDFTAAIRAQPQERRHRLSLANAFVELGTPARAELELIRAIQLDPAHAYPYAAYADYLYEADRLDRALRIYTLGYYLPGGDYCGTRAQDIRDEQSPPPEEETPADEPQETEENGDTP